jgi:hypothetical protein
MNATLLAMKKEEKPIAIDFSEKTETHYDFLSKEKALALTAEVIEKYRPALEELAK